MILALLLQATAPLPGTLPRQALPARACAAYLWSMDRRFVAVAGADPAQLRVALDGKVVDIARASESGAGDYGFAASTVYAGGGIAATLDMTIVRQPSMSAGATVPAATLTIARAGQDSVVLPVAGLIACVEAQPTR